MLFTRSGQLYWLTDWECFFFFSTMMSKYIPFKYNGNSNGKNLIRLARFSKKKKFPTNSRYFTWNGQNTGISIKKYAELFVSISHTRACSCLCHVYPPFFFCFWKMEFLFLNNSSSYYRNHIFICFNDLACWCRYT